MKIFYFTSTGNNLAIAKRLGSKLYSIPKVLKGKQFEFEDSEIGIIFPCYYLGTPSIVKEFLSKVTLKAEYIFAIMSYGNIAAGGVNHFHKLTRQNGIKLSYLNDILMVDNYLPLFEVQKQLDLIPKKKIDENLSKILDDIDLRKHYIKRTGLLKNFASLLALTIGEKFVHGNVDAKFSVESNCNSCGICAQVCPVDNIRLETKPQYLHNCIECLGCIHHCPQNAIRLKGEKSKLRFINKEIKLSEIVKANN